MCIYSAVPASCIISFLYIKPQHVNVPRVERTVVLYRFSTSNHNLMWSTFLFLMLYYIVSLHQTTTLSHYEVAFHRCIISFLYIKPQLRCSEARTPPSCIISFLYIKPQHTETTTKRYEVVLYRFSTSNHNAQLCLSRYEKLYYIVSLHQTTTGRPITLAESRCIISFLYIKPQLIAV